jgi:hypothetical protein
MTAPDMKCPGRRAPRDGHPALSSKCRMYSTNCTPMGAIAFAQSAMTSTGQRDPRPS